MAIQFYGQFAKGKTQAEPAQIPTGEDGLQFYGQFAETGQQILSTRPTEPVKISEPQPEPRRELDLFTRVVETVKGLDLPKLSQSLIAGAKATPGLFQQGAGIILQGWVSQQKAVNSFFSVIPAPIRRTIVPFGIAPTAPEPVVRKAEEIAKEQREAGTKSYREAVEEYGRTFTPSEGFQGYLEMAAFSLPPMVASTGLAVATMVVTKNPYLATTVGLSSGFGLGASEVYSEARVEGLTDRQALSLSMVGGVVIGALDFLPLGRLLRRTGANETVKRSIIRKAASGIVSAGIQAGFEGITEGAQEIVGGAIASTYNENRDIFEGVTEAAVVGVLLGGLADVSVSSVVGILGKTAKQKEVTADIEKKVNDALTTSPEERTTEQKEIVKAIVSGEFSPEEAMSLVVGTELQNTEIGKRIVSLSIQAEEQGMNIRIKPTDDERGLNIELIGKEETVVEPEVPTEPTALRGIKGIDKAGQYTSATDFAKAEFDAKPTDQIGRLLATQIEARDSVDEVGVENYVTRINAREEIEPVEIVKEDEKLTTVEGSHRITAYQRLDQPALVIYRGEDTIEGLQTFEEIYNAAEKPPIEKPAEREVAIPKELEPLAKEARIVFEPKSKTFAVRDFTGRQYAGFKTFEEALAKSKDIPIEEAKNIITQATIGAKPKVPKKKKVTPQAFPKRARQELSEELRTVISQSESQEQAVKNLGEWLNRNIKKPASDLQNKRLKAIKADLNKQMFEVVGARTGNWKKDYAYFQTLRDDPSFSDLISRMEEGIFEIDKALAEKPVTLGAPGSRASKGDFSTVESIKREVEGIRAVEFPELLRLAEQFGQRPVLNRRLRSVYGRAKGVFIDLSPDIFKDEDIIAKVLAHEIGHVADYLPQKTMARGNLVGRIASLKKHMKQVYGELSDPEIRQELKDLTQLWKPFDDGANVGYTRYRYSSAELYADAVSVLLNDPALLQQKAPRFYKGFFDYLNKKPVVKKNFEATWDLLNQGEEEIFRKRDEHLNRSFEKGEEAYAAKYLDKQKRKTSLMYHVRILFDDVNQPIITKINQLRQSGKELPAELNPDYALKGLIYSEGALKNYVNDSFQPVFTKAQEVNDGWNQLGKILFFERVLNERGDLANPQGYSPKTAQKQLQTMKERMNKRDWQTLQDAKKMLRTTVKKSLTEAEANEYYTPELLEQMKANPAYATYQVVDYLDTYITPRVYRQKGTLKDIANPATSTVMKLISVHKAIKRNNVKRLNMDFLEENFPDSIQKAKTRWNGKSLDIKDPQDPTMGLVVVIEKGRPQGYYVEKDIAEMLNHTANTTLEAAARVARVVSQSRFYRPLFTAYNFGFQTFNFVRDIKRAWKNFPQRTLADVPLSPIFDAYKVGRGYVKATVPAFKHITNKPDDLIKEMENINILGFTYRDLYSGEVDPEATEIERIFEKVGIFEKTKKRNIFYPLTWTLDKVQAAGDFIETLPKVAGYIELKGRLPQAELAEYIRTSIGSPAFRYQGKVTPVTNNIFLFSNAIKEGIKSDYRVATGKKGKSTGASFWWKTIISEFLPKFIMAAIAAGYFGNKLKEIMDKASEYDKTNYTIIPLGIDEKGQAVYWRLPSDETGRFLGGLMWKAINVAKGSGVKEISNIFAFGAGQFPNLSPSFTGAGALVQYLEGKNPYDSFRGRHIIPATEFRAGIKYSLPVLLDWLGKNQGLGVMFPAYKPDRPTDLQKVLTAPFASNIIGRWIKVSDFGEVEQLRGIERAEEKKQAQKRLKEREIIDKAIEEYNEDPSVRKRLELRKRIVRDVVGSLYPTKSEDKRRKNNVLKKFDIGVLRGSISPQLDVLINADTNAEKVSLLLTIEKQLPQSEFDDLLKLIQRERIVGKTVVSEWRRQRK